MGDQLRQGTGASGKAKAKSLLAGSGSQKKLQYALSSRICARIAGDENASKESSRATRAFDMFHGRNGSVNEIRELLEGRPPYDRLWVDIDGKRFLSPCIAKGDLLQPYVAFTEHSLSLNAASGNELLGGISILNQGKRAFAGGKKFLAYYELFCDGKGNYPSGKTDEDCIAFIASKFTAAPSADDDTGEAGSDGEESADSELPPTFAAFFVHGPFAEKNYQLEQFVRAIVKRQKKMGGTV